MCCSQASHRQLTRSDKKWKEMQLVGYQPDGKELMFELRNCRNCPKCFSTLSRRCIVVVQRYLREAQPVRPRQEPGAGASRTRSVHLRDESDGGPFCIERASAA
jgi:hypothetical protein